MLQIIRTLADSKEEIDDEQAIVTREWLVTNGLGGYASGTISGVITRRYHGLLIAAMPAPLGRTVMLSHLSELIRLPNGKDVRLTGEEFVGGILELHGARLLTQFRLETGLPVWRYEFDGYILEKQILLPHLQNTVHIVYRLRAGEGSVRVKLRPSVHFRSHEEAVDTPMAERYVLSSIDGRIELSAGPQYPTLRMMLRGQRSVFTIEGKKIRHLLYRAEESRGYEASGDLWSPGYFAVNLSKDETAAFIASTETWPVFSSLSIEEALKAENDRRSRLLESADPKARSGTAAQLVLAADQFIITPAGRVEEAARAHAFGDEVRTVIAGYHWFTDWGRDTMISLEGLTLNTGRFVEAGYILRTFAEYVREGLIPNLFPEREKEGLYHTADATLWFFHALQRYLDITGDRATLRIILPKLREIFEWHVKGTRFGIAADHNDALLRQGEQGFQLTWMDAKVDNWVVTPRRGKAVEINALWYNAICLLERWMREEGDGHAADGYKEYAARVSRSFNERFWYPEGQYLFDVVDGEKENDPAFRPNQIFAISLPNPVLDPSRWAPVLAAVRDRLLTPMGLRSLAPGEDDYKPAYFGDLRSRDAAYHQGTVWAWLIGPFVDAWIRAYPYERASSRRFLKAFQEHLNEACVGSISEIFDAESPFTPRGCIAQAWSVAEVLRAWLKTEQ